MSAFECGFTCGPTACSTSGLAPVLDRIAIMRPRSAGDSAAACVRVSSPTENGKRGMDFASCPTSRMPSMPRTLRWRCSSWSQRGPSTPASRVGYTQMSALFLSNRRTRRPRIGDARSRRRDHRRSGRHLQSMARLGQRQCERARPRCSDCSCAAGPAVGHRSTRATAVAGEPAERLAELAEPPVRRGDGCTVAALCGVDETASGCRIRPSGGFVDRSCSRGRLQRLGTSVAFIPRQLRDRTVFADRAAGSDLGLFRQGLTGHVVGLDASRHEVPDRSCDGGRLVFGHERA